MNLNSFISSFRARFFFLLRYGTAGATGGMVQTGVLYVWVTLLGLADTYLVGLGLGFVIALATTFLLQKFWAFRDGEMRRSPHQLLSYTAVALTGLLLNAGLLMFAKEIFETAGLNFFGGWYIVVQIGVVGVVSVFNFSMNFLFTFRHARRQRLWEGLPRSSEEDPLENGRV